MKNKAKTLATAFLMMASLLPLQSCGKKEKTMGQKVDEINQEVKDKTQDAKDAAAKKERDIKREIKE